jgi:hypothetical protein
MGMIANRLCKEAQQGLSIRFFQASLCNIPPSKLRSRTLLE